MYATYITIYKGNKLPPFYIGHAKVENIENGYLGSVSSKKYKSIWKEEISKNRGLFSIKILKIFNNKSDALSHERLIQKTLKVHTNSLYINMSIVKDNFFVSNPECHKGKKHSEETKKKLSLSNKKQFDDPIKRQRHLDGCYKSNGNHINKIWINKNRKNKRVTKEEYKNNFNDWNIGRYFGDGPKFYEYGNREKCPKTGRFIKGE
jgi:hypothetical protein